MRGIIEGKAFKTPEALEAGLIDGVADDREAVRALIYKRFDNVLRLPKLAYLATRESYRRMTLVKILDVQKTDLIGAALLLASPAFEEALNRIKQMNK